MNKSLKIFLSVLFVLAVGFFVARGCWNIEVKVTPKKMPPHAPSKKKPPVKTVHKTAAAPKGTTHEMAIILDDWGYNLTLVKNVAAIGRPITLSILPHLPHSADIAEEAKKSGLGVMLHMPMEPKGSRAPREPRTILTTTSDEDIRLYLDAALESVPHVEGVNNHQGSLATGDERVMKTVLSHLKKKGLFFVDSHVVASSVCEKVASAVGIPFASRDVFIDNQTVSEDIQAQLREAQKIALTSGRVVVIGHDKKVTVQAIHDMVPELEKNGVKLVLVKDLTQ